MGFVPIAVEDYIGLHLKSNPKEDPAALRKRLREYVAAALAGARCHCGAPIWVIGSASAGHACFTCITGEAFPSDDYEIDRVLDAAANRDEAKPSLMRRRFLQLLATAGAAGAVMGKSLAGYSDPPRTQTPRSPSGLPADITHARRPLVRDVKAGYLLNENFWALSPYLNLADIRLSGWETDFSGGTMDLSPKNQMTLDWFKLIDTSEKRAVTIKHQIARQSEGQVTLEYRFRLPSRMDGAAWELRDLNEAGVRIVTAGANLCYETPSGQLEAIQPYETGHDYGVKVVADITEKTASIYVDGDSRVKVAPFRRPISTLDYVLIKTGDAATGELFLSPVNVHKGYSVCETFVSCGVGKAPADWVVETSGGTVAVQEFNCGPKPDVFSARLENTRAGASATLRKDFIPLRHKTVFECRFLLPEKVDGIRVELSQGARPAFRLVTAGGDLCFVDSQGHPEPLARNFRSNLWYMAKIVADPETSTVDVFVNGKLAALGASFMNPVPAVDRVQFSTAFGGHGVMWVDDVQVYLWQEYPADYVPEPKPCPAKPPYILGLQSASIHREGSAYIGWDWVQPVARERKPFLGWYEDGSPEVADWEIKWQVEHGIEYELYCWYRPNNAFGNPIKDGSADHAIIKGLFNARYGHLKKFAIMYEDQQGPMASWGRSNPEDFVNNIIPYWIEYFFKDPRYLKIEGKPVLSIYLLGSFLANFGGEEGARKALATLREECTKAGFAGVTLLMEHREADRNVLQSMKAIGVDYCYAYTWGTPELSVQRSKNEAQRGAAAAVGLGMLPMLSVGWETSAWDGPKGPGSASVPDYKTQARWLKDEFMPTLPADSLGRRMLMIDNWNEFGEGHFIMPSVLAGFGYLDVLRKVFTEGGEHEDAAPAEQQKRRFTVLYPKD
jgi:hypothetical protein